MLFYEAVMVGIAGALSQLDSKLFGEARIGQPMVIGAVTGLLLGHAAEGSVIGAEFQLIWMGVMGIGATPSVDVGAGTAVGTAFAVLKCSAPLGRPNGAGMEAALLFGLLFAVLMRHANVIVRDRLMPFLTRAGVRCAEAGMDGMIAPLHIAGILLFTLLLGFLPCFLAVLLCCEPFAAAWNSMPVFALNGLRGAAKLAPVLGLALLLNVMLQRRFLPFFLIGFVLTACAGLDMTVVTSALMLAAVVVFVLRCSRITHTADDVSAEDEL